MQAFSVSGDKGRTSGNIRKAVTKRNRFHSRRYQDWLEAMGAMWPKCTTHTLYGAFIANSRHFSDAMKRY